MVTVSELYYKDGRTQQDIAERLGISRATVINYLKQSRDQGLVEIKIKGSAYQGSELELELRRKYALKEVYITNTDHKRTAHEAHLSTARLAAKALEGLLKNGDRIAQLIIAKHTSVVWEEVEQLEDSPRGSSGFGSTGI